MNTSNLLNLQSFDDPRYKSLIFKILEAKAVDCLCTGYSKQNTEKQLSKALNEINQGFTRFLLSLALSFIFTFFIQIGSVKTHWILRMLYHPQIVIIFHLFHQY